MNENNDKMIKQKSSSDDAQEKEAADDDDAENVCGSFSIPLPIQTFLWRQTSPFIRPRSKLQDAAAMEQREACKLFEKVLVQNIRFGLSPSLTKAIASISRWRLIVAALPHVMHCCSALLYARRKSSFDKLSASETKLLYTLHWILLDAAEECADEENERGIHRPPEHYLLPVTTIQTFCYLFAPLIPHLKQSDFLASFRLENGYKIWIPLFNYCHPEIPSFIAHAKQNTFSLSRTDRRIAIPKFGDVFIGSGPSTTDAPATSTTTTTAITTTATAATSNDNAITKSVVSAAAAAAVAKSTNLVERKDSYDIFGEPITSGNNNEQSTKGDLKKKYEFIKKDLAEPSLATYLDVAVLRCLFTSQWIEDGIDWALNFLYHRLECIQKNQEKRHRYRFRSNSLPAPFRRGGVFSEPKTTTPTPPPLLSSSVYSSHSHIQSESKLINRPNDNNNNNTVPDGSSPSSSYYTSQITPYSSNDHHSSNNNNNNKMDRHDVKLKTFQDVRRSSFSGLPGLSGFQALISSTSSASFGRHGSEKVKHHKKAKKQQQRSTPNDSQNDAGKSSTNNPNNKFHHRSLSTSKAKHSLHILSNKNDTATRSANKSKSNKHKDKDKDKDHHQTIDENCVPQAPTTTTTADSRPSSVNSMKNRFETRLVDRDEFKSMPELHLIDDGQQQALPIKEKFPSISLIPEVVRSPSHSSLIEYSTMAERQQQPQQQQQTNSVPFPIITITEHSPVQSMHFFNNNNNNNHNNSSDPMKRSNNDPTTDLAMVPASKYKFYIEDDDSVTDQHHQHPVDRQRQQQLKRHQHQHQHYRDQQQEFDQQLQQPSSAWKMMLFRSKSDSHINYTIETSGESLASMNYVNKNGQLSLVVILKAIHSITLRDSVCSMRVCKMIYKIINKLMSFKLISKRIGDIYNAKKFKTFKPNYDNPELSVHHLFMDTLFRIVKQLGCSKGCGEGRREIEAVRLKENVMKALKQLHEMSEMQFLQYCEMLVTSHPIQEVLDIFHAFFAFCSEVPPAPAISSQQHLTTAFPFKKSFGQASTGSHGQLTYKNGYYNNFGAGFAGTTASSATAATASSSSKIALVKQEVGCIIVKCTFKPFISRLVFVQKELKVQDNMSLYCEIRQFIAYARDHHGGIFRNAALSGLIESTKFVLNSDKILPSKMMMVLKDDTTDQPQYQPQPQATNSNNFTRSTIPEETSTNDKLIKRKKFNVLPVVSTNYRSKSLMDSSQGIIVQTSATNTDIQQSSQPPEWLPDLSSSNRNLQFGATTSQTINNHHHHNNSNSQMDLDQTRFNAVDPTTFKAKQYQQPATTPQRPDNDSMMMISYDGGINAQQSPMPDSALQNYPGISLDQQQQSMMASDNKLIRRGSFNRQTLKGYIGNNSTPQQQQQQANYVLSMNPKSTTFFKARKRMDQFKNVFGKNRIKQNSFDETPDMSRKNSLDFERLQQEMIMIPEMPLKKSKQIFMEILKDGMLKFQFLLESCTPGTIPDAQLIAAMLDLKAPVVARAAFLLECCRFVHRCNRGQWPAWMRINFNFFRQSGPRSGSQSVMKSRASTTLQKLAGRCFYQWAELLSSRLEDILQTEIELKQIATNDEQQQQQLLQQQLDDDDFYSVPTTDTKEGSCPFALRIVACQLLYEITTYLRETHQYLLSQSSRRTSVVATVAAAAAAQQPERRCLAEPQPMPSTSLMKHPVNTNRRWSMALSTTGPVHLLDHCMVQPSERRISFVLHEAEGENDSGSLIGSSEDIAYPQDRKRLSQVGPSSLTSWAAGRSGSGHESFRRRSIKLKKNDSSHKKGNQKLRSATLVEDDYKSMFKRSNSLRSKRKVSIASEKSDTSDKYSGEESPGFQTEESHPGFQNILNNTTDTNDSEMIENLPWLKITTLFATALNFECSHQNCANNCHKRIIRSTAKLTKEVQRLYDKDIQPMGDFDQISQRLVEDREDLTKKEKKLKKILMGHYQSSPLKRKASALNMERNLERDSHSQSVYNSSMGLAHTNIDLEFGMYDSEDPRLIFHDVLNYRLESKQEENVTMLYILNQVKNPFHSIISMMLKSALILNRNQFEYLIQISWNLILDDDIQISSSACVSIIVCSLKCPDLVVNLLNNDLNHQNVDIRVNAIKKFSKIWGNRHQCWQRLEEGAHLVLKLPPAAIEFTLPSPRIALECKPVVDPPYMPIAKTKVDEVAINQEPSIQKSFVAATKTRRKQQIELVSKALQDQEDKLREERENYRFTSVPVTLQAAYEPVLYHTIDDHDDNEDDVERIPLHHLQVAQCFFPSSLTTASFLIVNLLEDTQINSEGVAVFDVAYKVIWHCLCDDPALFLRNLLEKLTREKKNVVIQTIRRLIRFVPRLPAQAAFTLYNYLIGFIMYHVRTPTENSQEIIASVMSILWLIVPNVFGLFLKDLKQILRKEQCDATILITANVPSAKKIIVHGPELGSIPTQFPVHEDTQFSQILTDSLDFFGIDESKHNEYFLVDTKTNQIHNLNAFVRDFYFFKRSQYPQLSLVHMNPIEAYDKFQRQAFTLQFTELGKCLMTLSLIKTSFLGIQRVLFLHEDLMKLPSFPRKALETNLTLYTGPMGREVLGIDTLHKISWVKLVARMFEATSGFFADASDIHLFLNVINGTLLLHCEDATILRLCMATYINAAHQFKNIFATNGYLLIVQTIVQIYATHQTNSLLCRTIEFVFKQFYILHSKPFVLQMFGAVAPLLDTDTSAKYETNCQVHPKAFFQLLQSLGQYTADPLDILELVDAEKPLKALDFCYQMDPETLTVLDSISLCVTVISYAPDSERGHQMLTVLDSILPFHLMHMQTLTTKKETPGGPRAELTMIHNISVCIKTLIYNCEALTRNFTGPQKALDVREASIKNQSPFIEIDEDSHSKFNPDSYYPPRHNRIELDDGELSRMEFRKPRDLLLKIVSEFLTKSTSRFAELSKKISEIHGKNSSYELLDVKCHIRLAEIAHSLLKLAPYDPPTMACKGLVRYMNEILPNSEWRQESMRPALIMVLRRLDKTFAKISKKTAIKRTTDWEAARRLLKGVYLTFVKHPYIVHLPHLKSLINVCQNIILGDQTSYLSDSSSSAVSSWTMALSQAPPPGFISVAVRLISLQMIQLGDSQSLETICSGAFSSPEKSEIYLMNMIYPMCIRTTSGMKDTPKFRQCDINFVLNVILNILKPINSKPTKGSDSSQAGVQLKQFSLQQIGFLGLKILITCFEKQLTTEWYHIAKCIKDLADKPHLIGSTFWNFIDFVCTYRTPLFVLMLPYIKCKYLQKTCESEIEQIYQSRTQEKLNGGNMPYNRSKGYLYVQLVNEMKSLREDIIKRKFNPNIDERSKSIAQEQASASEKPENSGHRLSFAFSQLAASASKQSNISSTVQNTSSSSFAQQQQQQQSSHGNAGGDPSTSSSQPSAALSSIRPRVLRGLSFRLSSDSRRLASRGLSVKLASNQSDKRMFVRRTSYPDHPDIDKNVVALKPPGESTGSESKLFRQLAITNTSSSVKNSKPKGSISFSGETLAENKENKMHKETSFTIPSTTTATTTIINNNQKDQQQQQSRYLQRQQQKNQQNKRSFRFKKGSNSSEEQSSSSKSQSIAESEFENTTNTTTTTTINTTTRVSTPTKVLAGIKSSLVVPLCDNNEIKADSDKNKNIETTTKSITTTTTTTNLNPYSTINDCDKLTTTTTINNNHSPNNNKSGGNNNNNNNNDDENFENNGNHDDGHRPPPSFEMNNNTAAATAANMLTSAARALDTASSTATTNIDSSINVLPYADEQT